MEKLTPQQDILARYMGDVSERYYCAGWMIGLEYRLWRAVTDPTDGRYYGMGQITTDEVDALRWLSEQLGGWIRWEDEVGEVFVPINEWKRYFDDRRHAP